MSADNKSSDTFHFKNFSVKQDRCAMKVNTDGVLLGAWAPLPALQEVSVLDIGAGTGMIALLLAERLPGAKVIAVEIDEAAAEQAAENVTASPFANIEVICASIQTYTPQSKDRFDLIVSNPPFFSGGALSVGENRANARHTLKLSHGDLLGAVRDLLAPGGQFAVILPLIEGMRLIDLATSYGLHLQQRLEVRPRDHKPVHRLLLSFSNTPAEVQKEKLIHYGEGTAWTEGYRRLVGQYYRDPK